MSGFDNELTSGARLVDNKSWPPFGFTGSVQVPVNYIFGGLTATSGDFLPAHWIDTQGYVSFSMFLNPAAAAGSTFFGINPFVNVDIAIQWATDWVTGLVVQATGTQLLEMPVYSPAAAFGALLVRGPCKSRYLTVRTSNWWGTPVNPTMTAALQLSSTVQQTLSLTPLLNFNGNAGDDGGIGNDGFLFRTSWTNVNPGGIVLAAGASTGTFVCPPYSGAVRIVLTGISNGTVGAQGRISGGFGSASANAREVLLYTPANLPLTAAQPVYLDFPAVPNRPFTFGITNLGNQPGTFHAEVYALAA